MYRIILFLFSVALTQFINGQSVKAGKTKSKDELSGFSLSISTYNHAEYLFTGTLTYQLKNRKLMIIRQPRFSKKANIEFSREIADSLIEKIKLIRLDTLQDYYFNYCVMATSGTEYEVLRTLDRRTRKISFHHYYKKEVDDLILQLNHLVSEKYKIDYLSADTKQDCE